MKRWEDEVREDAVAFVYVVCARDQRALAFPAHSLKYRNTYAWKRVASERVKRTFL
jgi:hypothetical protein